jgi:hypothetical protein
MVPSLVPPVILAFEDACLNPSLFLPALLLEEAVEQMCEAHRVGSAVGIDLGEEARSAGRSGSTRCS